MSGFQSGIVWSPLSQAEGPRFGVKGAERNDYVYPSGLYLFYMRTLQILSLHIIDSIMCVVLCYVYCMWTPGRVAAALVAANRDPNKIEN